MKTKSGKGTSIAVGGDTPNANPFRHYKQEENRFTNGLISLLSMSPPKFASAFFRDLLHIEPIGALETFCVLRDIPGHADAQLCGSDSCIWFETKIACGSVSDSQLSRHLRRLQNCRGRLKRLVLLTPDDSNSNYIKRVRSKFKPRVLHLQWRKVYDYLEGKAGKDATTTFSMLVRRFLEQIHDRIFEQDYAGIIQKVAFGEKANIYAETFLDDLRAGARGEWTYWNTPQKYEKLDGTGRKLMFYDKTYETGVGDPGAIVGEVEIRKIKRTNQSRNFPWSNYLAPGTLRVYPKSMRIPRAHILGVPGFENFVRAWSGHWNVTHEQYRLLKEWRAGWQQSGARIDRDPGYGHF